MNKIKQLFNISYPLVQAGMIWCSGWELASAVSNAGGLGLIGSGSMYPDVLKDHIRKCKQATDKPFGVNLPLIYKHAEDNISVILEEGVKIVFTSAGNPMKYTSFFKENGLTVVHVIANTKFARKCEDAGVDAIVAEGFEAGGHDGLEETTTFALIPQIREISSLPLIAAGGIANGQGMFAAMALGADGVQIGSRFAASVESSGHPEFKRRIIEAKDGDTVLTLKKVIPVRLLRNRFWEQVKLMEDQGASREDLTEILGHGRARKGMFEGDLDEGELEIGQVAGLIHEILPAAKIVEMIIEEFNHTRDEMEGISFE